MNDEQLIRDIIRINKSKTSQHFYLLHLDLIIDYAMDDRIEHFHFYEKVPIE